MKYKYKIFGERNCGTNLLRVLVGNDAFLPDDTGMTNWNLVNTAALAIGCVAPRLYDAIYDRVTLTAHERIFGWKHAVPIVSHLQSGCVTPVIIVKHPSFWLNSFIRQPFHHYSKSPCYRPRRIENMEGWEIGLEELILVKLKAYRSVLEECGGILVQYETLVAYFEESHEKLETIFGECRPLPDREVRSFVQSNNVNYAKSYNTHSLVDENIFSQEKLEAAESLLRFFGYEPLNWKKKLPSTL